MGVIPKKELKNSVLRNHPLMQKLEPSMWVFFYLFHVSLKQNLGASFWNFTFSSLCFLTSLSKIECVYFYYSKWVRIKEAVLLVLFILKVSSSFFNHLKSLTIISHRIRTFWTRKDLRSPFWFESWKDSLRKVIYSTNVIWLLNC